MSSSALIGHLPNNDDDYAIIRGFARLLGIPDEKLDPAKGFPLMVKPPAGHPSYASQGPGINASMGVAIALVTIITGTRLFLRGFRRDLSFSYDDCVIIPALIGAIAWWGLAIGIAVKGGAGKHLYDVTYIESHWFSRLPSVSTVLFWATVAFVKISITLFNRRLTCLTSRRWRITHNIFLTFLIVFPIIANCMNVFQCNPIADQYSLILYGRNPTKIHYFDPNTLGLSLSVVHIVTDFALLSDPLIVLSKIRMSTEAKLRLGFLFRIGSISCIGSIMRPVLQNQSDPDLTWAYQTQLSWTTVDLFFALTAASLPVLNPAFPKRLRGVIDRMPQLGNLSRLERGHRGSARLGSDERLGQSSRADGTILDEKDEVAGDQGKMGLDVERDNFKRRMEARWDAAFVGRPEAAEVATKRDEMEVDEMLLCQFGM